MSKGPLIRVKASLPLRTQSLDASKKRVLVTGMVGGSSLQCCLPFPGFRLLRNTAGRPIAKMQKYDKNMLCIPPGEVPEGVVPNSKPSIHLS